MKEQHHKSLGAWLPAEILYNHSITPRQKILYCTIANLANQKGYCWATNAYFAKEFDVSTRSVQRDILILKEADLINMELIPNTSGDERRLKIVRGDKSVMGGGGTGVTHKNINNTNLYVETENVPTNVFLLNLIENNKKTLRHLPKAVLGKTVTSDEATGIIEVMENYNFVRDLYMDNKSSITPDAKACRQTVELLRDGWTTEQIKSVAYNMFEDDYAKTRKWDYITPEYLTRTKSFQKYA